MAEEGARVVVADIDSVLGLQTCSDIGAGGGMAIFQTLDVTDEEQWRVLLLPPDPNDGRNVILEIRGAAGGEEANLFAKDLFDMFESFAKRQGWRMEVMSASHSDLGGFSEVTAMLSGDAVWTRMKHEAGTHRVQRVPVTESQGRVHTSSATVLVIPEADEVEIEVDDNDLRIDTYRASGPGGQSVNTMDSAVRITHLPTGVVVSMQDEKSQLKNKDKALRVLKSRLLQLEQEKADADDKRFKVMLIERGLCSAETVDVYAANLRRRPGGGWPSSDGVCDFCKIRHGGPCHAKMLSEGKKPPKWDERDVQGPEGASHRPR